MKTLLSNSAALVLVLILQLHGRAEYIITDLGAGIAYGINVTGQVVGQNGDGHAFLYSNGVPRDLGTFGGAYSFALNLNDNGQAVGWAQTADGNTHGFLYSNGTMLNLSPNSLTAGAQGINSSGAVVGWYAKSNSGTQPFLYSNGSESNLGSFPAGSDTYPLSINASRQMVGYTYQPGVTAEQPFLIQNGTTRILDFSGAFQMINGSGQAAGGRYFSNTVWHALLYSDGSMTDLGTLGGLTSWAYGINDSGQIVGDSTTASGADHAYLYSDGKMTDLNSLIDPQSGWTLETAYAINDSGQIVGYGINANGETDAFLLTSVPEPAGLTLLCFGTAGAFGYACWRRTDGWAGWALQDSDL